MPRKAIIYVLIILFSALMLSIFALPSLAEFMAQLPLFLVLVVLTTVAHLYNSDTASHEAWSINLVFLFTGVILLNPFDFVLLVIIPHTVEWGYEVWVKKSDRLRNWYIQPFNMAVHIIAGFAAHAIFMSLNPDSTTLISGAAFLAASMAMLAYLLINHILIGGVLVFARGVTLHESGMFEIGNLLSDLFQFGLGYVVAVFWTLNPILIVPALAPLALMYRAIQVPKLAKEAHTDPKTGLLNTRHFNELFNTEIERARRFDRPLGVVMADLDLLRNINNTYGHLAGDTVLTGIGKIIRDNIREYDIAARFGGEEFSMVLLECGVQEAQAFANRLRHAIETAEFTVSTSAQPIRVTMSLGVACFPADAATSTDLIHLADVAVYQAKLQGRNRVVCVSDVPRSLKLEDPATESIATPAPTATPTTMYAAATAFRVEPAPNQAAPAGVPGVDRGSESVAPAKPVSLSPQRLPRQLQVFIAATIAAGVLLTLWGLTVWHTPEPLQLGLFVALAIAAEIFQITVYGFNTVSVSVAVIFASGLLGGLPSVAATSVAVAVTHYLQVRPQPYQSIFNWATHVIAGTAPALAAYTLGLSLQVANLPLLLGMTVIAGLLYYILDTGWIAIAIGLAEKESIQATWQAQFRWLMVYYLALCVLGTFLAIAYTALGLPGVIVFALPPFMMHYAQKQYVERTEESTRELRRLNQELTRANREIAGANQAIQDLNDELFLVMAKIVDARDPYVSSHTVKVADYSVAVATELGLSEPRVEAIRQAALLHDIGKIAISEQILNKPDKLSSEEYLTIKSHTTVGAELLETCQGLQSLAPYVKHHHEWWDGTGYPDRLAGDAIPLEARILAVCDAVEAMASDRPYHRALSLAEIVNELERCAGTQFDPHIVNVFIRVANQRSGDFVVNSAREVARQHAFHQRARAYGSQATMTPALATASSTGLRLH
jgi:diguanylate cyclase (GGDEF)-like protein/putative nucleotidyltransferase with HDIG domain